MLPTKSVLFISFFMMFINTVNNTVLAQFSDNFSDEDFTSNPSWFGTDSLFIVNKDGELQVYDQTASEAFLFTESEIAQQVEWNFRVKLAFSPSDNNSVKIWLLIDEFDLHTLTIYRGVYFLIGEQGNSDAGRLYEYNYGESNQILCGIDGSLASAFSKDFKIRRTINNEWIIFSKNSNEFTYTIEDRGYYNSTINNSNYFGIHCKYTKSNAQNFYFDNFEVKTLDIDLTKPTITNLIYNFDNSFSVFFSKPIIHNSVYSYYLQNSFLNPDTIIPTSPNSCKVLFKKVFNEDYVDYLCVSDISDLNFNILKDTCIYFKINYLCTGDVVINEILFDNTPQMSYDKKFVEIFNKTHLPVSLSNWILEVSPEKYFILEDTIINNNSYYVLNKDNYKYFTLPDSGTLKLKMPNGKIIDSIFYEKYLFSSSEKSKGGWSLERFNNNLLFECIDTCGSTPNKANSIDTIDFPLTKQPCYHDILINEIMFYGVDPISDYIEIYNNTDTCINLYDLKLKVYDSEGKSKEQHFFNKIIFPNSFLVLTKDTSNLQAFFPFTDAQCFNKIDNCVTLNNESGNLSILIRDKSYVVDSVYYSEEMHYVLIKDKTNVSLERISLQRGSTDITNWHSAASTYNYGSPGVENSQSYIWNYPSDSTFILEVNPKIFSSGNNGLNNTVDICYSFPENGYTITLDIYDISGSLIKNLVNNFLAELNGCITWDGIDNNNLEVRSGTYIILLKGFSNSGKKIVKKCIVNAL